MKKYIICLFTLLCALSCTEKRHLTVNNNSGLDFIDHTVEIPLSELEDIYDTEKKFILKDQEHEEVPYQITYDNKLIFQVSIGRYDSKTFYIKQGIPSDYDTLACGKYYPNRMDDIAWENDKVAFRLFGPALENAGTRLFGYDLFLKRNTTKPVLEYMFDRQTDPVLVNKVKELKENDPARSDSLRLAISYHHDHGYGLDCYPVGPTLGAGTTALLENDTIIYPWTYQDFEILDNGPLRFTVKLIYPAKEIEGKEVTETRIISLDAGSHFNKTEISYSNLQHDTRLMTGIVMHSPDAASVTDLENRYMTATDEMADTLNGTVYLGCVFPDEILETGNYLFSDKEKKERGNAYGHVAAIAEYEKDDDAYEYYWGYGWSRSDIENINQWNEYTFDFVQKLKNPLTFQFN